MYEIFYKKKKMKRFCDVKKGHNRVKSFCLTKKKVFKLLFSFEKIKINGKKIIDKISNVLLVIVYINTV